MSHRGGSHTHPGDIARSHMPALPSPVLGWRSSTDGLCPPLCSLTPSTLLRWAGSACSASAVPGSCCSLPASLSSAARRPTRSGTRAQPHQCQHPAGLLRLPHTHLTPARVPPNPCPCPLLPVDCPLPAAAGQADGDLWPFSPPAVAHSVAKENLSRRMRLC